MKKITEAEYKDIMARIDSLMGKGSENVSPEELAEIRRLAQIAQEFEQEKYALNK